MPSNDNRPSQTQIRKHYNNQQDTANHSQTHSLQFALRALVGGWEKTIKSLLGNFWFRGRERALFSTAAVRLGLRSQEVTDET
jgi:hypothetical protein